MSYSKTGSDPLGLTPEQRANGLQFDMEEDLKVAAREFLDRVRRNLEFLDSLPDGTIIECSLPGCNCGGIPIEAVR